MKIQEEKRWYVLRAKFNRALIAQDLLLKLSIDSFVPMELRSVVCKGKKIHTKLVPIISNLIFVDTTFSRIIELKAVYQYLYYLTHNLNGKIEPMYVPRDQMQQFKDFIEGNFEHIEQIDPNGLDFSKGDKVKIISGVFKGKEGFFMKVKGKRSKQVVVAIDGIVAVMISDLHSSMIAKII